MVPKNGVEISKFWMIQKPYILYIKKNKKDCYKMISGHHNSRKIWIHQNMSGNILHSKKYSVIYMLLIFGMSSDSPFSEQLIEVFAKLGGFQIII